MSGALGGRGRRGALKATDATQCHSPAPSSCLMTEWGEWDECSATCGMGMKKRHRMVKMSPADGSMCKAETSQAEKCMMPECREWAGGRGQWTTAALFLSSLRLSSCRWKYGSLSVQHIARNNIRSIMCGHHPDAESHSEQCWGGKLAASAWNSPVAVFDRTPEYLWGG